MIITAPTKTNNRQFELFNAESLPEVISLYGERPGCFSLLVKPPFKEARQRSYPVAQLPAILQALDPDIDSYISQAQFFKRNRRVVNLWSVGLCWVDLDTYNTHYGELKPEYAAFAVRMFLQDEGMQAPSMIIHSGRGIYLKWLFEKGIPRDALPRWNAVQATIVRRLQKFGADPNAKDASRVLRLVRTTNTKQDDPDLRVVRVLHVEEQDGQPVRYAFDDFANEILPFSREEIADLRSIRAAAKETIAAVKDPKRQALWKFSEKTLHWSRFEDLDRLITLRGGIAEGGREHWLFLMINSALASGQIAPSETYREAEAIARRIDPEFRRGTEAGYRDSDLSSVYARAKHGNQLYKFRNATMIEKLQITSDEERELKTIISRGEKLRRRRVKRREETGAEQRQRARRAEVHRLRAEGLTIPAIAERLGVGIATVNRDL